MICASFAFQKLQTFMLPSMTFSRPCRSTLNGVCAASGKCGALFGSAIFLLLASWLGNAQVVTLCAIVSVIAAILTLFFIDDTASSETCLDDKNEVKRTSSEAHLLALQEEDISCSLNMPKTTSVPTFLDLE